MSANLNKLDIIGRMSAKSVEMAENPRVDEMRRMGRIYLGIGSAVFLVGLGLVGWSVCRMRHGKIVGALSIAVIGFGIYRSMDYQIRRRRIVDSHREEIDARTNASLGAIYFVGQKGVPQNYEMAVKYLEMSVANPMCECPQSRGLLAECYLSGKGCKKDLSKARQHAEVGAKLGDRRSQDILDSLERQAIEP